MGVDLNGLSPHIAEPKPDRGEFINNKDFYDAINEWERRNPGFYFGTNWWTWRPIYAVIKKVNEEYKLDLDISRMDENSGFGLKTQYDCNLLADAIQSYLDKNESDSVQVCYGSWADFNGKRLSPLEIDSLNEDYPQGTLLYTGVAMDDKIAISNHYAHREDFNRFISFLKNCGGFEVW